MADAPVVLFFQKRSRRAGAQRSLARLIRSRTFSSIRPVVVLGEPGWLADELRRYGILTWVIPFPSPRAFKTRLLGLGGFTRRVRRELDASDVQPTVVFANDHQECPLALAVAESVGNVPVLALLRSAAMRERDFHKYRCAHCDTLLCVGETLHRKVRLWSKKEPILFHEGFGEDECFPIQEPSPDFPTRVLIIGTEDPAKGFTDFIEAIDQIEAAHPDFPPLQCDFTGTEPAGHSALLEQRRRATFTFLGRIDDFSARLRDYPLVIHPSRAETFGMAPIEAILAGTPTLLSATGVASDSTELSPWTFPPENPRALAEKLVQIWKSWPDCCTDLEELQQKLRESFSIDQTTQPIRIALAAHGIP